jgi:hypothetical protein
MSYGVVESELLSEDTALRRVQEATSYKCRLGRGAKKEVNCSL